MCFVNDWSGSAKSPSHIWMNFKPSFTFFKQHMSTNHRMHFTFQTLVWSKFIPFLKINLKIFSSPNRNITRTHRAIQMSDLWKWELQLNWAQIHTKRSQLLRFTNLKTTLSTQTSSGLIRWRASLKIPNIFSGEVIVWRVRLRLALSQNGGWRENGWRDCPRARENGWCDCLPTLDLNMELVVQALHAVWFIRDTASLTLNTYG